jgi:hypothetical protein
MREDREDRGLHENRDDVSLRHHPNTPQLDKKMYPITFFTVVGK